MLDRARVNCHRARAPPGQPTWPTREGIAGTHTANTSTDYRVGNITVLKQLEVSLSLGAVILGHTVAWLPVVVRLIYARPQRFDRRLEKASLDWGQSCTNAYVVHDACRLHARDHRVGAITIKVTLGIAGVALAFLRFGVGGETTVEPSSSDATASPVKQVYVR